MPRANFYIPKGYLSPTHCCCWLLASSDFLDVIAGVRLNGHHARKGESRRRAPASAANLNRGGRRKGSKNRVSKATLPKILDQVVPQLERQQGIDQILEKMLGLVVDSPVKIDGNGVDMRDRIARFLAGDSTVQLHQSSSACSRSCLATAIAGRRRRRPPTPAAGASSSLRSAAYHGRTTYRPQLAALGCPQGN
jgi:hypothetical protein